MTKIVNQLLTLSDINQLKVFWNDNQHRVEHKYYDENLTKLDLRVSIHKSDNVYALIESVVNYMLPDCPNFYSAYERQHNPTTLHIDPASKYTFIISLDEDTRIKTLVWKETFKDAEEFHNFIMSWEKPDYDPSIKISDVYPLNHTYDDNRQTYIADYLTVDSVFEYRLGSAVCFLGNQIHCSSDWRDYVDSKDFIVVHTK